MLSNKERTKEQLAGELAGLRQRVAELETLETERRKAEEEIVKLAKFPSENPNPVMRVAQNGTVLYANQAALPLLNEWRCQIGQLVPDYWHKFISEVLNSGLKKDAEIELGNRLLSLMFTPVVDADYVNLYGLDITERKQAEETLRLQSEIAVNMTEGVYLVGLDDVVIRYTNPKFEEMFGYEPGEMVGKPVSIVNAPTDKPSEETAKEIMDIIYKTGEWHGEVNNIKKDGTPFWCYANVSVFEHPEYGKVLVAVHTDITERKQAEEELRFYSKIIANMSEGVYIIRANDSVIVYANPKFEEIFGYGPGEIVGKHVSIVNAPTEKSPEETAEEIIEAINKTGGWRGEIQNIKKDGTLFWCYASVAVFDHPVYGEVWIVVHTDITERKQAEEALRESEVKYRGLVTNVKLGIFRSTPEPAGRFLEVNPALEEITGYSRKELLQMKTSDLYVYPQERELVLEEVASGRGKATKEVYLRKKDGTEVVVLDRKVAVRNDTGKILYFDGILEDITERKQAEERERELQQELSFSKRLASIGELAAGVAHEINNPLTGILGFSERLLRKSTDEEIRQDLERLHNEAQRMVKVMDNLRTFTRRREPERQYSDINDILQKALELRAYELRTGNIEVVTDFARSLPEIEVDFHQIQEVFLNIILNAEQVMTEAHGGGKLTIKAGKIKDNIRISFTDDGPGIPAEHLDKLFDPFFTTREEKGGTGLGLSVCHGIVTEHGGRLRVKSKPGGGATFFVELPCP